MNNMLRKIGFCAVLFMAAATAVSAKEWRGIVPLKSTRQDVERLFGVQKKSSEGIAYYNLSSEIVAFHFSVGTCEGDRFGFSWNVPPDTVVGIGVIPKGVHRKEEYLAGSNLNAQDEGAGLIYYSDNAAGLTIETYKNVVTLVDYSPEASQDNLHCPKIDNCCFHFRTRFDEYEETSFSNEKVRLDNLVIIMTEMFARGVIEILGPSKRDRQNQMKRAARGKSYLIKERGLEPERLLLMDGGFNETAFTRLNIYTIGGLAGRIFLDRRSDPDEAAPKKPLRAKVGRTR